MNIYLTVMVTVLVATQIIRIAQNAISLHRQNKQFEDDIAWIKDSKVSKKDFEVQREVIYMLHEKLEKEREE